jgi:hypothetical protein
METSITPAFLKQSAAQPSGSKKEMMCGVGIERADSGTLWGN